MAKLRVTVRQVKSSNKHFILRPSSVTESGYLSTSTFLHDVFNPKRLNRLKSYPHLWEALLKAFRID